MSQTAGWKKQIEEPKSIYWITRKSVKGSVIDRTDLAHLDIQDDDTIKLLMMVNKVSDPIEDESYYEIAPAIVFRNAGEYEMLAQLDMDFVSEESNKEDARSEAVDWMEKMDVETSQGIARDIEGRNWNPV